MTLWSSAPEVMGKDSLVPRPARNTEYVLKFASAGAQKNWRDLVATMRNPMVETWDFLTQSPQATTPTNYPLRGALGTVTRGGKTYDRWQHKPTLKAGARVWFYVEGAVVYIEQVHTTHPNATK